MNDRDKARRIELAKKEAYERLSDPEWEEYCRLQIEFFAELDAFRDATGPDAGRLDEVERRLRDGKAG